MAAHIFKVDSHQARNLMMGDNTELEAWCNERGCVVFMCRGLPTVSDDFRVLVETDDQNAAFEFKMRWL